MQLIDAPDKLVLPFANTGGKNTIPAASQIGITAGAASLEDGFPPLTRTPLAAGGVPPSGLDMNGILFEMSAVVRWANAGGAYPWDTTFANDADVGGYPEGATVLSTDSNGVWISTSDNNVSDPENAATTTWVPGVFYGATSVAMSAANVTLTRLQAAYPIVVITGTLSADLNLVFPTFVKEWLVVNNSTGAYSVTAKTASGTGVALTSGSAAVLYGDGTNIYQVTSGITQAAADARYLQLAGGTLTGLMVGHTGANIASATTLNLSTATGNTVHVTGTTATTGVTMTAGQWMQCIADGAWPLTYHATNNKLNTGGTNYTCAAGDSVFYFYDGTTVYGQIVKADGTPVAGYTSMVRLNTANGYGSTNTNIRRFTNTVTNTGSDVTYTDSASLGGSFTINTDGIYAIAYSDQFNTGSAMGLSLNTTAPTTSIRTIPVGEILTACQGFTNYGGVASWTGRLPAGSIIRAHTEGDGSGTSPNVCQFTITRVA